MTARLYTAIGTLIAVMIASAPPAQPPGRAAHGGPPTLVAAEHWDVSRPLREMPRRPPQAGSLHEAPSFRQVIGPKSIDPVVQSSPAPSLVPGPMLSFEGVGNVNGVLPPDTNGAIGPNHYVQWVNLSFAVYARGAAGSTPTLTYGPVAGNTLWTGFGGPCETTNSGDPVVRYDQLADRWVMSQLALPNAFFGLYFAPFYQCIAVSATPDPTGPYYRYQYSFQKLNDYPKLGVWPDAYYMTMNQFNAPFLTWGGQGAVAFDRTAMLQGRPANMIYFDLASVDMKLGGMLPSDLDGPAPPPGSPNVYMEMDDDASGFPQDQLQLWKFHVDWTTPSNSTFTLGAVLPTAPFDSNLCGGAGNCVPQPGTTQTLDTLSDRLMYRLQYRNFGDHESLVANHTVDVDGTDHAGIRWYEIRDPNGLPSIYQQGTYAPDSDHRWMGSAAMDAAGNIAVGFSVSSTSTYPSIRYAARLSTDPLGTLAQGETTLIAGSGSETHSTGRWGDYSMMTVDPNDGCTFWYTQEYFTAGASAAGWQTRIGAFNLPSCAPPSSSQPRVTVSASTPIAKEAGPVNGAFTVSRTGDTSAPMTVAYTVSGTATPGADYVPLDISVTIPAGAASANIPVVVIDDTLVEPDESVILTLLPSADYSLGSPASAIVTIVSDDAPPDLVVSALTAPATGGAAAAVSITDTTLNQGKGVASASVTGFYLSANTLLDASDVALGTRTVPQLGPGVSSTATTTLTIPAGTATGSYFIIAVADSNNAVPETSETNNTRVSTSLRIGPDLVVSTLTVPASGGAGLAISIGDTTTNSGGGDAPSTNTGFYLSTNPTLAASAVLLGSRAAGPLAAGAASTGTTPVTIPAGTATGIYYVIAKADYDNQAAETNETNNTRVSGQIRVGPDLVETSVSVPSIGGSGATILVTDTVRNQGLGDAPASTTGFYISTTVTFSSSATRFASRAVPALPAGQSSTASTPVTLPSGLAPGGYFVFASADVNNDVVETVETNNTSFGQIVRIGPDLVVSSFAVPLSIATGVSVNANNTILNQGGGSAAASTARFYLSINSTVDASDVVVGSRAVAPLNAGQSDAGAVTILIPPGTAPGSYWLIAVADDGNAVPETTETNNTRAVLITVKAGSEQ